MPLCWYQGKFFLFSVTLCAFFCNQHKSNRGNNKYKDIDNNGNDNNNNNDDKDSNNNNNNNKQQ